MAHLFRLVWRQRRRAALTALGACVAVACSVQQDAAPAAIDQGGGGQTTTTSTTSTSTTVVDPGALGKSCTEDAQCDPQGRCIRASEDNASFATFLGASGLGGPAAGYCTVGCAADAECPGAGSQCFGLPAGGFCVLGCTFAEPALGPIDAALSADKCQGRDDEMCVAVASGGAVCVPICGADSECPSDRQCDLRSGLCAAQAHQGSALGAACIPDEPSTPADEDGCAGLCLTVEGPNDQPAAHNCSARCSLGGSLDATHNCGGPAQGACLLAPVIAPGMQAGLGDLGFCAAACATHDACNAAEGLFCFELAQAAQLGVGYCLAALRCPTGTECAPTALCVSSVYGRVCVDADPAHPSQPLFALGQAAGGLGGTGGSAGNAGAAASTGGVGGGAG